MTWKYEPERHALASKGVKTVCVCKWCPYGFEVGNEEDLNKMEWHLMKEHREEIVNYWIENDPEATRYKAIKMGDYPHYSLFVDDFDCPHCSFNSQYEDETKMHIAEHHWGDFLNETEGNMTCVYWESAVEFAIKEVCE